MALRPIRLVTFDALHTIIAPRLPVHIQYSQIFEPHLGRLNPHLIRQSFKNAFKLVEIELPASSKGSQAWWTEVIRKTALGAEADKEALEASLPDIVTQLMNRFSSREGYRTYDDTLPARLIRALRNELKVLTAVVSNADSRIRLVLRDLGFPSSLDPIVLSQEEGVEKPSPEIFFRALSRVNSTITQQGQTPIRPEECLHVGDELDADYKGALAAGMKALHLRRAGLDGEQAHREQQKVDQDVHTISDLNSVVDWVSNR